MEEPRKFKILEDKMDKSEQWLLDGKCTMCRRKEYCSKPCKRCRSRHEYEMRCHVAQAMAREIRTGGQS